MLFLFVELLGDRLKRMYPDDDKRGKDGRGSPDGKPAPRVVKSRYFEK